MAKSELQEILINARKEKQLTHEQVAALSDVSITRQYYGLIESGKRRPSVEVAKAIAKVLDLDWTIFFDLGSNQRLQRVKKVS